MSRPFAMIVASLSLWSLAAVSAAEIARMQVGPYAIEWIPETETAEWTLAVAGPDGTIETRRFYAEALPAFSLFDLMGQPLADGVYTWELREIARPADRREGARSPLQSGTFQVVGGRVYAGEGEEVERPFHRTKDQTVPDDLIVDGKGCIGLGCAPGEGFGGEALRLKQSVVRLRFEDTSATAGFPSRDWQLTVNDSASGGADKLSIEDLTAGTVPFTVRGGAPDNSLYVADSGRVGLGTAVPAATLHVSSGEVRFPGGTDSVNGFSTHFRFSDGRNYLRGTTILADDGGRVGIGILAPLVRLDVLSNDSGLAVQRLRNANPSGYSGSEYLDDSGTVSLFFGLDNAANTTSLSSINNHPITLLTQSAERMRITSSGNVGVGTASPSERFHVFQNADINTLIVAENLSTGVSAAGVLRAKSDSATVNFQAHGSGRTLSRFGQPLASWAEFLQVGGNGLIIGTLISKPLILGTNNANRLHITGTGDVGIGTAGPTSRLHVSGGDIRVTGGSFIDDGVTLNAPDYVFEPDYQLMPLAELAKYVEDNKRLPNVPSAKEIKEQGIDLGAFQMRLLEKIEELALYTLEQDKQLEKLRSQNAALEERLARLEAEK